MNYENLRKICKYQIGPFTGIVGVYIAMISLLWHTSQTKSMIFENTISVLCLLFVFGVWGYASIYFSWTKEYGPVNVDSTKPLYAKNGFVYYLVTMIYFCAFCYFFKLDTFIFKNHILITFINYLTAFVFCLIIFIKGKMVYNKKKNEKKLAPEIIEPSYSNFVYQYFRGIEFHPAFPFQVDIKQFTNCRFGMMAWQLVILAFWFSSIRQIGFNYAIASSVVLQTIYIAKFFHWEIGYFYTLDIVLDRVGHYINHGCLFFVPSFYTIHTWIMVNNPPTLSKGVSIFIFSLGLLSIACNYWSDYQKQLFQKTKGNCTIWQEKAKYISVEQKDKTSKLLTSGFWGITRKMNYTFELLLAFFWCLTGYTCGIFVFSYFLFLSGLLVHRIYRDEEKCLKKYGQFWSEYTKCVPYRLIPKIF